MLRGEIFLQCQAETEYHRLKFRAYNRSPMTLDSVDLLIRISYSSGEYRSWAEAEFEFPIRLGPIESGWTQVVSLLDSGFYPRLDGRSLEVYMLRVWHNGRVEGHPLAGYFTGTYRTFDSTGNVHPGGGGAAKGWIDGDALFRIFQVSGSVYEHTIWDYALGGRWKETTDSAVDLNILSSNSIRYGGYTFRASAHQGDSGVVVEISHATELGADSLEFLTKPIPARRAKISS